MPILVTQRILARLCVGSVLSDDDTTRKRKIRTSKAGAPCKIKCKVSKVAPIESITLASDGSVTLLEHQWKAITADFDANVAHRAALLAKASLVQYEKMLYKKLVQQAQVMIQQKEQELSAIKAQTEQAVSKLQKSFNDANSIHNEMKECDSTTRQTDQQTAMSLTF
jgi:hypothetical protein